MDHGRLGVQIGIATGDRADQERHTSQGRNLVGGNGADVGEYPVEQIPGTGDGAAAGHVCQTMVNNDHSVNNNGGLLLTMDVVIAAVGIVLVISR